MRMKTQSNLNQLKNDLKRYADYWDQDSHPDFIRYLEFVESTNMCCFRSHLAGHCTGSAFVIDPGWERVLLLYHPFLQRWLQPGGHADGDPDLLAVATREAHEETGLALDAFHPVELGGRKRVPFDLDIHPIPARKKEPEHYHYDLRFLLTADPNLKLRPESTDMKLAWLPLDQVTDYTEEESVLRMVRKIDNLKK